MGIVTFEISHIAHVRTAKRVNGLIVVTHGKNGRAAAGEKLNPTVLQGGGILKLVDKNVAETALVGFTYRRIVLQQLVGAPQRLAKIDDPIPFAWRFVELVELHHASVECIVGLNSVGSK